MHHYLTDPDPSREMMDLPANISNFGRDDASLGEITVGFFIRVTVGFFIMRKLCAFKSTVISKFS